MKDGRMRSYLYQDVHTNPSQKQEGARSSVKLKKSLSPSLHVNTRDYEDYGKKMEDSLRQPRLQWCQMSQKAGLPEVRHLPLGRESNLPRARIW